MGCRGRGRFPFPCISLVVNPCFGQRRHSQLLTVESGNGYLGKINGEPAVIDRQQSNRLAPENFAQKHILLLPTKLPLVLYLTYHHLVRIPLPEAAPENFFPTPHTPLLASACPALRAAALGYIPDGI